MTRADSRNAARMVAAGLAALIVLVSHGTASAQFREFFESLLHQRLVATMQANSEPLAPFGSDGCSAGMSKGWAFFAASFPAFAKVHGGRPPWEHCCLAHDRRYHAGPPRGADASTSVSLRKSADEEARQCIVRTAETRERALAAAYGISRREVARIYRAIADTTYTAVRAGGAPCTGLDWRWGFGLPNC
jgi:hypothetical protein